MQRFTVWHDDGQKKVIHHLDPESAAMTYAYEHIAPPDVRAQVITKSVEVRVDDGKVVRAYMLKGAYMWAWDSA